jgi:hypothetical protein
VPVAPALVSLLSFRGRRVTAGPRTSDPRVDFYEDAICASVRTGCSFARSISCIWTGSTGGIVHSWTGSASCPPLLEGLTTAAERTCIPTSADKLEVGQPARRSCLLVQEALPRAADHGAQIRRMPGTCQLATALTSKSEEKSMPDNLTSPGPQDRSRITASSVSRKASLKFIHEKTLASH